jgi:hypothetical protein
MQDIPKLQLINSAITVHSFVVFFDYSSRILKRVQPKHYANGNCCFFAKHLALMTKINKMVARKQCPSRAIYLPVLVNSNNANPLGVKQNKHHNIFKK